jgi:hypothetical protein
MALSQEEGNIGNSEEQLKDINSGLPCLDSSPECVQQLTEAAVLMLPSCHGAIEHFHWLPKADKHH